MVTVLSPAGRLVASLDGVAGWSHPAEAWLLHEAVRTAPAHEPQIRAVEIGSYEGRTTIALALGMAARTSPGRVIAIDPHDRRPGQFETFTGNLEAAGIRDLVDPIPLTSQEARSRVPDRSVSVLFVDGSHAYDDVVRDIDDWTSALVPGAFVGFNDPWLSGVIRALRDRICRRGTPFRNARWMVNSLFFDYMPDTPWTDTDAARLRRLRRFLSAGRVWMRVTRNISGDGAEVRAPRLVDRLDRAVAGPAMEAILPVAADAIWPPGR